MKIIHLLGLDMPLSNEENKFVNEHTGKIWIEGLGERDQYLARNLVRKGIYKISKDNQHIFKKNEKNS
jgi:hypothetical protein